MFVSHDLMNALHPPLGSVVYLATPIKSENEIILCGRYAANKLAVHTLMMIGQMVYSPMLHWYAVKTTYNWPNSWGFWERPSFSMLDRCDCLLLLKLPGWEESIGVEAEVKRAYDKGKLMFEMTDPGKMNTVGPLNWDYWLMKSRTVESGSGSDV